ncbi:glycosyltransferase family 2 protein [Loigolactobacillus binensis]|uniref:Glycosyltransferase family 2 protein n=1 Tax=Loigolactobacillus binensis TaxID=2559922 RepID=A0ABW3EFU3_9LACO|nr:glycosyltransferase family 2 protein [Loigolactobacillus binensis]
MATKNMTQPTVSIIIPFYNEDEYQLSIALSSINYQIGINFNEVEVILVGDGGKQLENLDDFAVFNNLNIHYKYFTNSGGAGVARQRGMGMASGRYYMFVDADDEFYYDGALLEFFNAVKDGDHEVVVAKYIEQGRHADGSYFYLHNEPIWSAAYAKWFNRDYVARMDLHWLDDVRIFEDVYFCSMAIELASDVVWLNSFVYSWLYNEKSTVRDPALKFNIQLDQWAKMNKYYLRKIKERAPQKLAFDFGNSVATLFYWQKQNPGYDAAALDHEQQLMLKENADLWDSTQGIMQQQLQALHKPGSQYENYDISDFRDYLAHYEALLKN